MNRKAIALSALLLLSVTGCAVVATTAAVGAGIVYLSGEASKNYVASVDQTQQATLKAMEEMALPVLEQKRNHHY